MALIDKIFLHYFDIHFLEERGVRKIPQKIYYEAFWATRFSLLCADTVFVPASSYFESPTCRKIIDSYSEIIPYGIIWLIGKAHSCSEFCQGKTFQYSTHKEYQDIYSQALEQEVILPFCCRMRSSTDDIKSDWISRLDFSEVPEIFKYCYDFEVPSNIEERWSKLPDALGKDAFIVKNVLPILLPDVTKNQSITNALHEVVNRAYFQSYISELKSSIVTDLVVLESDYGFAGDKINIPYKYLLRELILRKKHDILKSYHPSELFVFRDSDEWSEIFTASLAKKYEMKKDFVSFHRNDVGCDNNSKRSIQIINKGVIMGDVYSAGQVAAQGPNSQASSNVFQQVWSQNQEKIDVNALHNELSKLRNTLKESANSPEEIVELSAIAEAEIAAKNGEGPKIFEYLSKAGKWSLNVAEQIGVEIAAAVIRQSLGIP
jgi:hypothetical protein